MQTPQWSSGRKTPRDAARDLLLEQSNGGIMLTVSWVCRDDFDLTCVAHNLCGASADHAPLAFCNPGLCAASTAVSRRHDCTIVSVFTTIFFPSSSDHHDLGDCEPTQTVSLVIVCKLCSFVLLDF